MSFDYRKEFTSFMTNWEKQEKIMRRENMSEEGISELYNLSYEQFKADRRYARKICDYTFADDVDDQSGEEIKKLGLSAPPKEFDKLFDGLMQTDNKCLMKGLRALSPTELQVITLVFEEGMNLRQISTLLNQKYDATQKQFYRAKGKLKKFL